MRHNIRNACDLEVIALFIEIGLRENGLRHHSTIGATFNRLGDAVTSVEMANQND